MKRLYTYIILPLLLLGSAAQAQEKGSMLDSISLGNAFGIRANINPSAGGCLFEKSPETDISNALYGQFSGLLVKTGSSVYDSNQSRLKLALRLHGHSPLILVDGLPREADDLMGLEIESISVLKDAAAAALYGVKGANGVVSITTKRGKDAPLKVTANYQYGFQMPFRNPEFADAYTYGFLVNEARSLDGLPAKYNDAELFALYSGQYPYAYPNVDWWNEVFRDHGDNHRAQFSFQGGNRNFRYFAAVDYLKEDFLYKKATADDRYNANHYDNRLGIRANVDVNITETTAMKVGVMARLGEFNKGNYSGRIENTLYYLPSAAFPVKQADGTYGGTSLFGPVNPVAQMQEVGQKQYSQTKVLADMLLRQDLGMLVEGLSADARVGFDYIGRLSEDATKDFRYSELLSTIATQGDQSYILSEQRYYGVDSKEVAHSHWFSSLQMKFELQGRLNWARDFDQSHLETHAAYRQRAWIVSGRNESSKTQEYLGNVSYNWNERFFADAVLNYSGSAYLPKGKRFHWYPGLSLAYVVLDNGPYMKAYGSAGLSGSDEDLEHELWRQNYVSGKSWYFGPNGGSSSSGRTESSMAAATLAPERSAKATLGTEWKFFDNRFSINAEGFLEKRTNILISPSNVSEVIGLDLNEQSLGQQSYKGVDLALAWDERRGDFDYGLYANGGWLWSKVIDDGQAFQQYDYLYHKGNPVGQRYGLEVIGIFQSQVEINNSPKQTFGEVRPGDLKYRDQNGDGVIDKQDRVKMFGSSTPLFQFGFGLHAGYKGLKVYADFQGVTGVTINLLDSPLYQPLVSNTTISNTFLNREVTWAPGRETVATMPRLTTQENPNNYQANSLWYRDGSFIKLRNAGISYTIPKSVMRLCETTIYVMGTNLFSLDNIHFADPEQLGAYYPSLRTIWAGIKMTFGEGGATKRVKPTKVPKVEAAPVEKIVERIVEKEVIREVPVEKIVEKVVEKPAAPFTGKYDDDIFFLIGRSELRPEEAFKLGQLCQILKENPDTKIQITGFADSGTGTDDINRRLSAERAAVVAKMLQDAGIARSRIEIGSVGGDRDASASPESNRVAVCIVKP
ncbi:MAG: SusC/RagA family TonB-linked outer membrane protein [Bacteroidales bacterium]|nr:SusC/RagA family TonB-linked outer membrane protein [Bacteroidales bacterium]